MMKASSCLVSGLCGLWCVALHAAAQAEDLPGSSACRTSIAALELAEDALVESAASAPARQRDEVAAKLKPLRQRVADACLGGLTTSPPPSQRTWLLPAAPARAQPLPPRAQPRPLPPLDLPRAEPPPVTVTHCNAATCTTSDGATLTRVGPGLVGPRGSCTVQGVFLRCP
ncbi:hypothetical protein ACG02S_21830 [Roseateles sp. DC23W]|uniref:Uncharacterized protein n=1 Tax=Pelomonas dachongensis TaxID=3299029 RepID=A0ABW7EWD7_9BURK